MNWENTVIKSSDIEWKSCKPKSTNDGKLDVDIHIPLTAIIEGQARKSFAMGLQVMYDFMYDFIKHSKQIDLQDFANFYDACGYPYFAKGIRATISDDYKIGKE
jgi:hypothetical protein